MLDACVIDPSSVRTQIYNIPSQIMQQYRDVTLSVDIMKFNNRAFFMTISKHIKFSTTSKLDSMENKIIVKHFKLVFGLYTNRGFRVKVVMAENQFESLRGDIADLGANINVVSHDEHVSEIQLYLRTIKERVRATHNMTPFKCIPPILIVEMVYANVFWRNMFPIKGGISSTQGPAEIILNCAMDFNTYGKLEFGDYVQTHEEHDNSMGTRAIATRPTGNLQGGYYFISLSTGRRITRREFTKLPMPADIVDQVHHHARRAKANTQV